MPAPVRYDSDYYFLRCAPEYFGGALQSRALIRLGAFGGILESLRQCIDKILRLGPLAGRNSSPLGHSQNGERIADLIVSGALDVRGLGFRQRAQGAFYVIGIEAIKEACRTFDVLEVSCDPFRWQAVMADLEHQGLPVSEYTTTSVQRIVPAWAKFFDAVMEKDVTHDGDARLARHVANLMLKSDRFGPRPTRDRNTPRTFIDLAIAAVIAYDRATAPQPPTHSRTLVTF